PTAGSPALTVSAGNTHLLEQLRGRVNLLHDPAHVADVDRDHAGHLRVEHPVGADRLPVAVEGQAHELAAGIQHRRTGVAAGDVQVGQEVHRDRADTRILQPAVAPGLD